jgi:predicted ABC-type ATPase
MPVLYVVAGPNGAGKTTVFNSLIPSGVDYINADLVVKSIKIVLLEDRKEGIVCHRDKPL